MRSAEREAPVCDLCLERPRSAALGATIRRERIATAAGADTVRRVLPRPLPVTPAPLAGTAA
jgi:hypothetical protein